MAKVNDYHIGIAVWEMPVLVNERLIIDGRILPLNRFHGKGGHPLGIGAGNHGSLAFRTAIDLRLSWYEVGLSINDLSQSHAKARPVNAATHAVPELHVEFNQVIQGFWLIESSGFSHGVQDVWQ